MFLDKSQKIKTFFLDLIFPKSCVICNKNNKFLCPNCFKEITINSIQVCPVCEKSITDSGKICLNCKNKDLPISQLIVATDYQKSEISKIIHYYKYNFVQELSTPLGKILLRSLIKNNCTVPDFMIPVPLHSHRLHWRGFNQSELLADYLSENLLPGMKIPVLNDLILRIKNTQPQMKIKKYTDRQKNLENAFTLNKKITNSSLPISKGEIKRRFLDFDYFRNKKFLIIDDVCTTGSTIFQCAKVIQKLNPASVSGIVLGRQS